MRKATSVLRKGSRRPLKRFTSDLQNGAETQNFYVRRGDWRETRMTNWQL